MGITCRSSKSLRNSCTVCLPGEYHITFADIDRNAEFLELKVPAPYKLYGSHDEWLRVLDQKTAVDVIVTNQMTNCDNAVRARYHAQVIEKEPLLINVEFMWLNNGFHEQTEQWLQRLLCKQASMEEYTHWCANCSRQSRDSEEG